LVKKTDNEALGYVVFSAFSSAKKSVQIRGITVRNMAGFDGSDLLAPRQNPKLKKYPLSIYAIAYSIHLH
jgi:hypothetical protein